MEGAYGSMESMITSRLMLMIGWEISQSVNGFGRIPQPFLIMLQSLQFQMMQDQTLRFNTPYSVVSGGYTTTKLTPLET